MLDCIALAFKYIGKANLRGDNAACLVSFKVVCEKIIQKEGTSFGRKGLFRRNVELRISISSFLLFSCLEKQICNC